MSPSALENFPGQENNPSSSPSPPSDGFWKRTTFSRKLHHNLRVSVGASEFITPSAVDDTNFDTCLTYSPIAESVIDKSVKTIKPKTRKRKIIRSISRQAKRTRYRKSSLPSCDTTPSPCFPPQTSNSLSTSDTGSSVSLPDYRLYSYSSTSSCLTSDAYSIQSPQVGDPTKSRCTWTLSPYPEPIFGDIVNDHFHDWIIQNMHLGWSWTPSLIDLVAVFGYPLPEDIPFPIKTLLEIFPDHVESS